MLRCFFVQRRNYPVFVWYVSSLPQTDRNKIQYVQTGLQADHLTGPLWLTHYLEKWLPSHVQIFNTKGSGAPSCMFKQVPLLLHLSKSLLIINVPWHSLLHNLWIWCSIIIEETCPEIHISGCIITACTPTNKLYNSTFYKKTKYKHTHI